jgi:hypothetical protein
MKKLGLIFGLLVTLMLAFSLNAFSQDREMTEGKRREANPEKRLEKMKERLTLTDSQTTQVKEINETYAILISAAKVKEYTDPRDRMKAVKEIREEQDGKILAILNDTQKIEWAKMKEEQKERRGNRKGKRGKNKD